MAEKIEFELSEQKYGLFKQYLEQESVTDIDYNYGRMWITDLDRGIYFAPEEISQEFISTFAKNVANAAGKNINQSNPYLEADANELRISIIDKSCAGELSISIRRAPAFVRNTIGTMVESKYCNKEVLSLLINLIKARATGIIGGNVNTGKTEMVKFLCQFIPDYLKTITIEGKKEIHYGKIKPNSNHVEIELKDEDDYPLAIKAALQHNVKWLIITEIRSREVQYFMEGLSTGAAGLTTLHLDDLNLLADRFGNMQGNEKESHLIENRVYQYIDWAILIRTYEKPGGGIGRYIDQLYFYDREDGRNMVFKIVDEGKLIENATFPSRIKEKLERIGIEYPFQCKEVDEFFKNTIKKELG